MKRRMLDLCCGLGGASSAFRKAGWDVVGVDAESKFSPEALADVRGLATLSPGDLCTFLGGPFDFVWASPPCQEFSLAPRCRRPENPDVSILLACLDVIEKLDPRFWCIENVRGAVRFFGPPTISDDRTWFFWGAVPGCIEIPAIKKKWWGSKRNRARNAARIPEEISERFRRGVESHLAEGWFSLDRRRQGSEIIAMIRRHAGRDAAPPSTS